ncbi:MAG: site-specific integrase [Clostridia bacterium]|nr:site-specific integrase [Clostridia bacterium]
MPKRKDNKGRTLKTGESQRKDGRYQYRYTDASGKRHTIYDVDLTQLRAKVDEVQKYISQGLDYAAGRINVVELLERYIELKQGVREATKELYAYVLNLAQKEDFCAREIAGIRVSDAKKWLIELSKQGRSYSTIRSIKAVVRPAFQMAVDEDALIKNPFCFKLADIITNDAKHRTALTPQQQEALMSFVKEDEVCRKYYDEIVLLLGTGLRASELCGLTVKDLDFEQGRIRVERQLLVKGKGEYHVSPPKTEHGVRFIPMTPDVKRSLESILTNRKNPKAEMLIDGCAGFILLGRSGCPKVYKQLQKDILTVKTRYDKAYPDSPMPKLTPHVFRHTFCTNMANAGMDAKTLQYLMGHSNVSITLNVYTHIGFDQAAKQMAKITDISSVSKASNV